MRILLVDNEPLLLKSYARYFKILMGHTVVTAAGGAEALAELKEGEPFDAIFCDVYMRGISGVEVHRTVCEHYAELADRFVFLTGGTTDEATANYIRHSGARILEKPVGRAEFEKVLQATSHG